MILIKKQVTWLASSRSEAQVQVCLPVCGAPWWVLLQQSSTAVSHAFSVLCMYSKFGHHPHPLGYLWAKFCFFRGLHCWASPWRIIAYSLTHPAYLMPRKPKCLCFRIYYKMLCLMEAQTLHNAANFNFQGQRSRSNVTEIWSLSGAPWHIFLLSYINLGSIVFTAHPMICTIALVVLSVSYIHLSVIHA